MKFTTNEIEHMRNELSCNAVMSLVRHVSKKRSGTITPEAIRIVAKSLGITSRTVKSFFENAPKKKYTAALVACAREHGIKMYWYQFNPTTEICVAWLECDYRNDKGKHESKWTFKHWERNMVSQNNDFAVQKEAA
ncbi:hypothetical protein DI392_00830 [Vibrio albus]|uniref:Uncharacterized protein n=1 Tax=Vibrio albus TaxID=2200953 RepID=A0A2U3BDI0_9VIBR|nr:hypothetical protein [Vibrio albus]PWI34858.1 hypothetical protein DI392_00830 [Vibrio albus]